MCSSDLEDFSALTESDPNLRFIFSRQQVERKLFDHLHADVTGAFHIVRRQPARQTDLDLMLSIGEEMEALLGH